MVRSEAQKLAQKRYRLKNRAKCNEINLASRHRRYNEVGSVYQRKYYEQNKNYINTDNMGLCLKKLFREV